MEDDDWIFLGNGSGAASDSDSVSEDGSDSDGGFAIVRRGHSHKGGGGCSSSSVSDDAPRVAAVAVPQPTPQGLCSFKVVSYAEAFSAEDGGGGNGQPGCNDEATAGEAIGQEGAGDGIDDDAAGTGGSTDDDCAVTCKEESCESDSDQVGEHDGTGGSVEEDPSASSVAVAAAQPVNCPETTAVLHGEAHSELASGVEVEQEDAEISGEEVEDDEDDSESSQDDDSDTDSSSEDDDDDTDSSSEEDTDSSSDEEDDDTDSSSDEEDGDTFSSSDEEYTEEIYSEEDEDEDEDAECSGEEEEEDGSESSGEESHDADNTGEEDDDSEVPAEEQEEEDAECSGEEESDDDLEISGEEEEEDAECSGIEDDGDDDLEISGGEEEEGSDAECSGNEDDVESSGDEPDDTESSSADSDDNAERYGEEEEEEDDDAESTEEEEEKEEEDTVSSGEEEGKKDTVSTGEEEEEESSDVVDVAGNGKKDIFAMLFPRATTACDAKAEQVAVAANANGAVNERCLSFPSKYYDDIDTGSSGSDSDMDTDSSDMEDDGCLESDEEADIVGVAENGNQDIFAMLFPRATASGANMDDDEDESKHGSIDYEEEEEEDGSLFDMLLPRDHAIDDDIDTDSSDMEDDGCLESDEEADIVGVAENGNQDIFAMLFARTTACQANIDDYEDESEHGSIDYEEEEEVVEEEDGSMLLPGDCAIDSDIDSSDGEDEPATAAAACGHSAEPSHGTRRPEFAARGYDDVDTDSDMEEGDDEVVAADVNGTSLYDLPRATTGGGVERHQRWGFASQSQMERQALWEDLRRQLAAEAFEPSGQQQQQRSYDNVDDTCGVPGTAAPGGGPAGSCARTPEAQFTARAVRDTEQEMAMEEARRREAAHRELDRALAIEAAVAAEALESALENCATAERQATGVTRPAVAERDVPVDITFIIGVYVLMYLVVSLLSLGLS